MVCLYDGVDGLSSAQSGLGGEARRMLDLSGGTMCHILMAPEFEGSELVAAGHRKLSGWRLSLRNLYLSSEDSLELVQQRVPLGH